MKTTGFDGSGLWLEKELSIESVGTIEFAQLLSPDIDPFEDLDFGHKSIVALALSFWACDLESTPVIRVDRRLPVSNGTTTIHWDHQITVTERPTDNRFVFPEDGDVIGVLYRTGFGREFLNEFDCSLYISLDNVVDDDNDLKLMASEVITLDEEVLLAFAKLPRQTAFLVGESKPTIFMRTNILKGSFNFNKIVLPFVDAMGEGNIGLIQWDATIGFDKNSTSFTDDVASLWSAMHALAKTFEVPIIFTAELLDGQVGQLDMDANENDVAIVFKPKRVLDSNADEVIGVEIFTAVHSGN